MTLGPWYTGDTPTTNIEIHVQRDGSDIELEGFTAAGVILTNAAGESVPWGSTPVIDYADDVVLVTPPAESPFATAGLYSMYLRLTATSGGKETFFATYIEVISLGVASGWASAADVRNITGASVGDADVALAQGVIELHSGRTFAGSSVNSSIRAKDLVWLKKAVAYQSAWQVTQPGYFGRHAVKEVNQDGALVVYAGGSEPNNTALIMLGPLAIRALKNLSWMRSRTIQFKPPTFEGDHPSYGDYKRSDDHGGWRPL